MPYTIRELRKQAGLSQEKLAEEIGVAPSSIKRWEGARANPKLLYRLRLAERFQISVDDIADAAPVEAPNDDHHDGQ